MDPRRNPFSPGAGAAPPELAGREKVVCDAGIALSRAKNGRNARSQILLGLRGVGKTVLLNQIERQAEREQYQTTFLEAPDDGAFLEDLARRMERVLRKLCGYENARHWARQGLAALGRFASAFKLKMGEVEVGVAPTPGVADSGSLDLDLTDLFLLIGEAAREAGGAWALLIDEVQYLSKEDLGALVVALHRATQKNLPIVLFAAGLPQTAKIAGDAKSYAERLFFYSQIGALDPPAARRAVEKPIVDEKEAIDEDALDEIVRETHGYPFFLQHWAHHAWNGATRSPITLADVRNAAEPARMELDEGFFRVRLDRLTPAETDYVRAMARLGDGPYKSVDVAGVLKRPTQSFGPRRASIIRKGMIYSPGHSEIDFTVPLFGDFLRRRITL